jgi:hypothetical protein
LIQPTGFPIALAGFSLDVGGEDLCHDGGPTTLQLLAVIVFIASIEDRLHACLYRIMGQPVPHVPTVLHLGGATKLEIHIVTHSLLS